MTAQRLCLDAATDMVGDLPGPILEFGLGNGRTYDHLRERCPDREIFVFDRQIAAHPDCIPDAQHMLLGDVRETIKLAASRIGAPAALAHCDIGSGDKAATEALAAWLGPELATLLAPGAIILADQPYRLDSFHPLPLPDGVAAGRYFFYRFQP